MNVMMSGSQTNGASVDLDLDPRLLDQLGWSGFWDKLKQRMEEELEQTRRVRPLLRLFDDEDLDPDAVPDFRPRHEESETKSRSPNDDARNGSGPPRSGRDDDCILSAPSNPRRVSAEISQRFRLTTNQLGDFPAAKFLISKAA